ncbi:HEAT repeat domain-containing protein [Micromonospora chokoriensis]|uniref:HEAT repeat domain-containing protein n=1 Tax=Micromonospora chokoriensis TaxID=356851 RepID=UPI000B2A0DAE|nr:HEAT repeat domain-containing protein [Micromonospora chokoriensis]
MDAELRAADFAAVVNAIARLIGLLDDDSTEVAEAAKAELISIGGEVVQPLSAAVGSLDPFGQLCAIEVFEHLGDAAAGPVLIDLLGSADETVREWSARAVAELGVREAVPQLRAAYRQQRLSGGELDWSEAVAIRAALTALGARHEVLPPLTAALRTTAASIQSAWPSARLVDVVNDLADHDQAVLYFMLWAVIDGRAFWNGHESVDEPLDVGKPWRQVVEDARESALLEAALVVPRPNLFATVEWIDRADV